MPEVKFVRDIDPDKEWLEQKLWCVGSLYFLTRSISFGMASNHPIEIYTSYVNGTPIGRPIQFRYEDTHERAIREFLTKSKIEGLKSVDSVVDEPFRDQKILCMLDIHDWNYSEHEYDTPPSAIRCHYCGKEYK